MKSTTAREVLQGHQMIRQNDTGLRFKDLICDFLKWFLLIFALKCINFILNKFNQLILTENSQ